MPPSQKAHSAPLSISALLHSAPLFVSCRASKKHPVGLDPPLPIKIGKTIIRNVNRGMSLSLDEGMCVSEGGAMCGAAAIVVHSPRLIVIVVVSDSRRC